MGLQELPNGMQYFSISEELKVWLDAVISGFTPIHAVIFIIGTIIIITTVIIIAFKNLASGVGG